MGLELERHEQGQDHKRQGGTISYKGLSRQIPRGWVSGYRHGSGHAESDVFKGVATLELPIIPPPFLRLRGVGDLLSTFSNSSNEILLCSFP